MARKKQSPRAGRGYSDEQRYYDEENSREYEPERIRFHSYGVEPRNSQPNRGRSGGYAQPPARGRKKTAVPAKKRKRKSRYRLAHPEKLLMNLGILVVAVIAIWICIGSLGGGSEQATGPAEDSVQTIQTVQTAESHPPKEAVRPVSSTSLGNIPDQLAAYMASMVNTNTDNYEAAPNGSGSSLGQFDPGKYAMVVAIDAGHGGSDKGWELDGAVEKEITLLMAQKVQTYINQNTPHYYAVLTRASDGALDDQKRLSQAGSNGAGLLVSLHCNGSELELGGTSAAYWTGDGDSDERALQSQLLAESLMTAAAEGFGMWEREVRVEENLLLQNTIPSVILEMGYITYELDNGLLQDEKLQDAAAEKIAQAIIAFMEEIAPPETENKQDGTSDESKTDSQMSQPQQGDGQAVDNSQVTTGKPLGENSQAASDSSQVSGEESKQP